jgi:hypothetical protein
LLFSLYLACKGCVACLVGAGHARGTVQDLPQIVERAD